MFDKHSWQPYGRSKKAVSLDINVKDSNEQTIDNVTLRKGKDIDNQRMLKRIKKHGFNLDVPVEVTEELEEEKKKDVDWLS